MRKRCLFGVADDLHRYAEEMVRRARELATARPIAQATYGPVSTSVVHRVARFQTELVVVSPNAYLPQHRHPGVETIECPLAGLIRLTIAGVDPYASIPDARLATFALGKMVRIASSAWHGGVSGPNGARFLSMQRWDEGDGILGERWEGEPMLGQRRAA